MGELKEQHKELILAVVGIVGAVGASVMGSGVIAEGSLIALILGIVVTICTYITQRGVVKAGKLNVQKEQVKSSSPMSYTASDSVSITTTLPPIK
jgi:hypothetical protein